MLGLGKHKDLVVLIIVSIDVVVVEFSPLGVLQFSFVGSSSTDFICGI